MLSYSLDEFGDFEGVRGVNEPVYIAGMIFDDGSFNDEEYVERKRIKAYYRAAIAEAATVAPASEGFTFPAALHSDGNRSRDHFVVRPVKEAVQDSITEFIKRGTYKGEPLRWVDPNTGRERNFPERKGRYYIYVILKSDRGMTRLLSENANILTKDNYASNLYFHMANEFISRLIIYNPLLDIEEISLDIATRTSSNLATDDPLALEYKKLQYTEKRCSSGDPNSNIYFTLTNPDMYRSVIAEGILASGKHTVRIANFNVRSISYHSPSHMEFLYLADSICSVLGFSIQGNTADDWLHCIVDKVASLTGRQDNLIFGYDEIDNTFAKAWEKYIEGDYYKALSIAFDAGKTQGAFAEYYKDVWFKKLEERILGSADVSAFNMAVRKLNETLNNNTLDQDKCFYILRILEQLAPGMMERLRSPEAWRILYMLYDIGVTACCHIGDSKNAEKYFLKCREHAWRVSLEEYLGTCNKMVVFCCDYFETDRAEEIANENIMYQELLTELKKEIQFPGMGEAGCFALGKAISQRGQVYAFKRDNRAEGAFREAMSYFEKGSANYKITQSYLLQHYLDLGERELYEEEAVSYFDGHARLADQLKYIIGEGAQRDPLINMKYALYIFVRALYRFYLSKLNNKLWSDLQKVEEKFGRKIKVKGWKLNGHPSELIFKYMRLIAFFRGETELAKNYKERIETCLIYRGVTEDVIIKFGEIEVAAANGDNRSRDVLTLELYRFLTDNFTAFNGLQIPDDGDIRYQWLDTQISFMYK